MTTRETPTEGVTGAAGGGSLGLRRFSLGPFDTNCYVLWPGVDRGGGEANPAAGTPCWLVDPGFEPGKAVRFVQEKGLRVELIALTHAHVDHIAGVDEASAALGSPPVAVHREENAWLLDPELNLSAAFGRPVTATGGKGAQRLLSGGEELRLGGLALRVLHTPGHSPGSVTFVCDSAGVAVVGDTLFAGSVGRSDFPGSDPATLARSIRGALYALPESTRVCPGHGPETTIGREKRTNPYVRA